MPVLSAVLKFKIPIIKMVYSDRFSSTLLNNLCSVSCEVLFNDKFLYHFIIHLYLLVLISYFVVVVTQILCIMLVNQVMCVMLSC